MTPEHLIADLRNRINPAYADRLGTDSYERRICAEALEAQADEIARLRSRLDRAEQTNAVLRRDLADPPGDIQELVLRKLGMWPPNEEDHLRRTSAG